MIDLDRRQFLKASSALPAVALLPEMRHRHSWDRHINWDAHKCRCGKIITGLEAHIKYGGKLPEFD